MLCIELAVIPSTFLLPTLALPTPAPMASTFLPAPPYPISIRRLLPLVSEWQTVYRRSLLLAQLLL